MIRETFAVLALGALALAQTAPTIAPLRTAPIEKFTVNPGFRDWARTVLAGTTIIGGNSSNRGGLFAVDTVTGKLKWAFRPTGTASGNPFVATAPAVSGGLAIVPMGNTLVAVTIATGREAWRGPATAQSAAVAADAGMAFVLGEDANFHALDAATGREKWAVPFPARGSCNSVPVARGGSVYVSRNVLVKAGDANQPAQYFRHLVALDASTGQERWRYPASPTGTVGLCIEEPLVAGGTYFGVSGETLYAINLTTGRDLWPPVEVRAPIDGRERAFPLAGLVDAGDVLVGVTPVALMAFDKATGRRAWQMPGQYRQDAPSTAVAGGVLYVQGHPGAKPTIEMQGANRLPGRQARGADAGAAGRTPERHRPRDPHRAVVVLASDGGSQLAFRIRHSGRWRTVGGFVPGVGQAPVGSAPSPAPRPDPAIAPRAAD